MCVCFNALCTSKKKRISYPAYDKFGGTHAFPATADADGDHNDSDDNDDSNPKYPFDIDFISLEVEGDELNFLRCFPFDKYSVYLWIIRTPLSMLNPRIDILMNQLGYAIYDRLAFKKQKGSTIYVRRSSTNENNAIYPWTSKTTHHFRPSIECPYNFDDDPL